MLDFVTRDIEVQCLPTDIPEHIDIDVTRADAAPVDPAARPAGEPEVEGGQRAETMLVHVVMPKAEEVGGDGDADGGGAAPAAAAEPEVIKKGKTDEGRTRAKKARIRSQLIA